MFRRRRRDAVSYWLQLLLSMGIATVGLVLGSTAVVIGAMLIAPLMGPIVELGMGLVVGSPVLTLRSFGRMTTSVVAVVGGAAVLTVLLPFHEITQEIASRTSPTALDLLLAIFVALAAAFTTARPGTDTTSAAAGTAIGIALVPPLCVMGFGIGVGDLGIARGATLLFLTNLTAILLVSVVFFWFLGFERVDESTWEEAALEEVEASSFLRRALEATRSVFGSRHGRVIRVGLPLLLAAAVLVPLRRALEQVAWEVRTRAAVARTVDATLESRPAVQTQISVSPGAISTRLYVVGSAGDAVTLERVLAARLAAATGVVPAVQVVAVPDAEALRQAAVTPSAEPSPGPVELASLRQRVGAALQESWPIEQLGPRLGWRLSVPDSTGAWIEVEYLGEPIGAAAEALLGQAVSERIGTSLGVRTRAYPAAAVEAPPSEGGAWLAQMEGRLALVEGHDRLHACVVIPAGAGTPDDAVGTEARERIRAAAAAVSAGRVTVDSTGALWSVRYSHSPCTRPDPAPDPPSSAGESTRP